MHLPTLSRRLAPDGGRVTDRQHAHDRAHGRPPESFKARQTEIYRGESRRGDTRQQGATEDKQREDRETREGHGWPRAWGVVEEGNGEEHDSRQPGRTHRRQHGTSHGDGETTGHNRRHTVSTEHTTDRQKEGREQTEKRVCNIFKGEKRGETPLRLANTHKSMYIRFTQYRGVLAVYCTFFYIY